MQATKRFLPLCELVMLFRKFRLPRTLNILRYIASKQLYVIIDCTLSYTINTYKWYPLLFYYVIFCSIWANFIF